MVKRDAKRIFFSLHPSSLILLFLLVACGDSATPTVVGPGPGQLTASPQVSPSVTVAVATTTASSPTAGTLINAVTATPGVVVAPSVTALPPTAAAPTATLAPGSATDREQVLKAVQKLATDSQSFRYKLVQQGELKSGGSLTQFEANGGGEWQRPAFHQLVTLQLEGQQKQLEHYGRDKQLFQRVVDLVVWRKQEPGVAGPFPDPGRVEQAGNFKALGKEAVGSQSAAKYSWEEPATRLLPSAGQPEGLGALSATNLYLAFTSDKTSLAQLTLWVDDTNGQPLRYQLTTTFSVGNNTLRYTATYDYLNFNDPTIKVEQPSDLLK